MMADNQSILSNAESGAGSDASWQSGLDPADLLILEQAREDDTAIVEEIFSGEDSLGRFSVLCLIFNRMMGSGLFNVIFIITKSTQSIGVSLILSFCASLAALTGLVLYIEMGLTIPRYLRDGVKISTIRSGGELPYLNYMLKRPRFLATCLFGIGFMVFATTAHNSVAFAVAVLEASSTATPSATHIAGIAIAANTFCCLIHSISRKWGIRLNNAFGSLKLLMLILVIIFGFVYLDKTVANDNLSTATSFSTTCSPKGAYRYAEAAIFAMFPFGGFHQANYVLAEIRQPRRYFAKTTAIGVLTICCLFTILNVLHVSIVPKHLLFNFESVASMNTAFSGALDSCNSARNDAARVNVSLEFFKRTIGRLTSSETQIRGIWGGFRALSAIGNVVVFTYTAARVKQEIAKEGILPFSLYLASSYTVSFRHGFQRHSDSSSSRLSNTDRAPAAALALHWIITVIWILAVTFGLHGSDGSFTYQPLYSLLSNAFTFGFSIFWFVILGFGMIYLRLFTRWRHKSPVPHTLGVVSAVLFTAINLFPFVSIWVPDPADRFLAGSDDKIPWFASQTTVISVVGASLFYWLAFRFYLRQRRLRKGEVLDVVRQPLFKPERQGRGLIEVYEIIKVDWTYLIDENPEKDASRVTGLSVTDTSQSDRYSRRASTLMR